MRTHNPIAVDTSTPTEQTMDHVNQPFNYMHTHPNAIIQSYTSDKILNIHLGVLHPSVGCGKKWAGVTRGGKYINRRLFNGHNVQYGTVAQI